MGKLLITGASGFIGSRLLRDLAGSWQVTGTALSHDGPGLVPLDLARPEEIERVLTGLHPSAVVHTAAMAAPDDCEKRPELARRVNAEATAVVARLCQRMGAHLIHFSTDLVFDGEGSWYKETDPPRPVNVYGRTKLAAEEAVLAACPQAVVLRVATVYGRALSGRPSFLDELHERLRRGQTVRCFADQWRTATPAGQLPDVVASLLRRADLSGVFHWTGPTRASRWEFSLAVCRAFGFPESLLEIGSTAEASLAAPRPRDTSLDSSRLSGLLGFSPWPLAEGLARARREWGPAGTC